MIGREKHHLERRDGSRLYYEVGGRGEPLVLIRGLSRSSAYWFDFRDLLEQQRRVLVLDNRGVGRSSTPRLPWGTEDMADDVADVLRDSGVERADVFGISLGGMIAQHLALRHPHRVRKLVLACTTPGGRGAKRIETRAALALARSAAMPFDRAIRHSAPWVLSADHLKRKPDTVERWIAIAASEPRDRRGVLGQLYAAARHEAWSMLHHIEHDTLLLHGDADRLIHPDNSRRLNGRIPGSTLRWLEGAGHDFPTERPHATRDHVLEFTGS
ncbi:MAG: alpha/beta hydrolase [Sandaracinaceae bacterium]|nr:MAG: alpha/beta hydrolase [Sandaracinaceae bacterium]